MATTYPISGNNFVLTSVNEAGQFDNLNTVTLQVGESLVGQPLQSTQTMTSASGLAIDPETSLTVLDGLGVVTLTLANGKSGMLKTVVSNTANAVTLWTSATSGLLGAGAVIISTGVGDTYSLVSLGALGWALVSRGSGNVAAANAVAGLPAVTA